jgi:hypothetical protein
MRAAIAVITGQGKRKAAPTKRAIWGNGLVFGDYRAGDSGWRARGNFLGYGVDHQGGAAVGEDGVALGAEGHAGCDHGDVSGAIRVYGQNKIRDVSRRHAHVIVFAVIHADGIEVRARGLEVGRIAFRKLVDVHKVRPGRQALDIELDLDAVRRVGKRGGANVLALGIDDVGDYGLWCCVLLGFLSKERCRGKSNKEQRGGDGSHSCTPMD